MSIQRMAQKLFSLFMLTNLSRSYQRNIATFKIGMAKTYIIGIKKARFLSIAIMIFLIALAVLVCGLILLHTALLTCCPLSVQAKWMVALLLGIMEIFGAVFVMVFLVKESTWIKFMEIDQVVRSVTDGKVYRRGGSDETKTNQKKHS